MKERHESPRRAAIVKRLEQASAAHFEYETSELHGVYDRQWGEWYAAYLLAHSWNELFEREWSAADLAAALRQADAAQRANAPDARWQEFYAEQFMAAP